MLKEEIDVERVNLDDLSLESDSGWRPLDPHHVQELVVSFKPLGNLELGV